MSLVHGSPPAGIEAVVGERHLDRLVRVDVEPAVRVDGLLEGEATDGQAVHAHRARGQQIDHRAHHARAVPRRVRAVRSAPRAHARDQLEPVVVPLLAEPQLGRAALVEADGDDGPAESRRRHRVVQAGGGARRLDGDVDAAARGALDRRAGAVRRRERSIASSAPSASASSRRDGHGVDDAVTRRAPASRAICTSSSPIAPRPTTATWSPSLIRASWAATQRDRPDADEQPALERRRRGQPHGRIGRGGGRRRGRAPPPRGAGRRCGRGRRAASSWTSAPASSTRADQLVAERRRIGGPRRVGPDERAQVAVEDAVGEGGGAAVEAQLGPVADAAEQRPDADLARSEVGRLLLPQLHCAWCFEQKRSSHSLLLPVFCVTERRA